MKDGRVGVFETSNHQRKEIYVGVAALSAPEYIRRLKEYPPVEISHWEPAEELTFRSIAVDMPIVEARRFADQYVFLIEQGGWRIIRQRPREDHQP